MGAAFIMTSYEKAVSLGVAKDKMIFPQCGADATDHWFVSERPAFDDSPAMRALWSSLQNFGVTTDETSHMDLYSCFPTVVQTACEVMNIDPLDEQRIPTLTGGLTFGGGPGNNYVTHSICAMVDKLRSDESSHGLVTGLGWFSTKHAWGTYSSTPPIKDFQWRSAQPDVDAQEKCVYEQRSGEVTIESYTVVHAKDGAPSKLVVAARSSDGVRSWSHSTDEGLMELSETQEIIGRSATVEESIISLK
jgi:acetyl-CoA C-acetyltransferase